MVKISTEWDTGPEQGKSSGRIATFSLWTGMFRDGIYPFLVKQLYRCDSLVISSFVRTGYTTRRWGWLLGRIGYSITHHYPLYYSPTGRRNHGRPLKRLLDTWDRKGSTSGPTSWKIYDDDDDDDDDDEVISMVLACEWQLLAAAVWVTYWWRHVLRFLLSHAVKSTA